MKRDVLAFFVIMFSFFCNVLQCLSKGSGGMSKLLKNITVAFIGATIIVLGIAAGYLVNENNKLKLELSEKTKAEQKRKQDEEQRLQEEMNNRLPLENKSIVTIGDSITWLDGNIVNDVGEVTGYQQLLREDGATVYSYGLAGGTYRLKNGLSARNHRSIYKEVVEQRLVNFSNVDIVTLFGGTNDVGVGLNLGKPTSTDPNETLGALNLLIDDIKMNHPTTKIYLFTPIYSTKGNRPEKEMERLIAGFKEVAQIKQVKFIDLYHDFPISKETSQRYLYDGLHPNSDGMRIIGERMKEEIEADNHDEST